MHNVPGYVLKGIFEKPNVPASRIYVKSSNFLYTSKRPLVNSLCPLIVCLSSWCDREVFMPSNYFWQCDEAEPFSSSKNSQKLNLCSILKISTNVPGYTLTGIFENPSFTLPVSSLKVRTFFIQPCAR